MLAGASMVPVAQQLQGPGHHGRCTGTGAAGAGGHHPGSWTGGGAVRCLTTSAAAACASRGAAASGSPATTSAPSGAGSAEALAALVGGILRGHRLSISRAISLCESTRPDHQEQAAALLHLLEERRRQGARAAGPGG